jgi:hypothetical protein
MHARDACPAQDKKCLNLVSGRKTPVVMTTQEYVGKSHPSLPIRSLVEPGTAEEQMGKWISEDPTRLPGVREDMTKWRRFFVKLKEHPEDLKIYNEDGQQQVKWWREFLSNGLGGLCGVKETVKPRK